MCPGNVDSGCSIHLSCFSFFLFFLLRLLLQIFKVEWTIKINNSCYVAASLCEQFSNECSDFLLGQLFNKTPLKAYLFHEPSFF